MMQPEGPICQSCAMPLSRDERGGGTESNGSTSSEYCSHCYQGGRFTSPDLTAEQMMARVRGKMLEMRLPEAVASDLATKIPSLKRWKRD